MTTKRITEELPSRQLRTTIHKSPRNQRRKVIITIIEHSGEKNWPIEFEIDGFQLTTEQGVRELPNPENFEPNGQYRGCFKFWRGCDSYEGFVAKEKI